MRSIALSGLVLLLSSCFDVTVTSNWSGSTGTDTAVCTAFVATTTTAYPSYDYSMALDPLTAGSSDTVLFDHSTITAGAYLWVECSLDDGTTASKAFCDVDDPERRDFLDMIINSDGSVDCFEGVAPPM